MTGALSDGEYWTDQRMDAYGDDVCDCPTGDQPTHIMNSNGCAKQYPGGGTTEKTRYEK